MIENEHKNRLFFPPALSQKCMPSASLIMRGNNRTKQQNKSSMKKIIIAAAAAALCATSVYGQDVEQLFKDCGNMAGAVTVSLPPKGGLPEGVKAEDMPDLPEDIDSIKTVHFNNPTDSLKRSLKSRLDGLRSVGFKQAFDVDKSGKRATLYMSGGKNVMVALAEGDRKAALVVIYGRRLLENVNVAMGRPGAKEKTAHGDR